MTTNKYYILKHNNKNYAFKRKVIETETNIEVDSSYDLTISTIDYPKYNKYETGIIEENITIPVTYNISSIEPRNFITTGSRIWMDDLTFAIYTNSSIIFGDSNTTFLKSFMLIVKTSSDMTRLYFTPINSSITSRRNVNIYKSDAEEGFCYIQVELEDSNKTLRSTILSDGYTFYDNATTLLTSLNDEFRTIQIDGSTKGEVYIPFKNIITSRDVLRLSLGYYIPDSYPNKEVLENYNIELVKAFDVKNIDKKINDIELTIKLTTEPVYRGLQKSYALKRKVN